LCMHECMAGFEYNNYSVGFRQELVGLLIMRLVQLVVIYMCLSVSFAKTAGVAR